MSPDSLSPLQEGVEGCSPPPIHTPGAKRLRGSHEGFVEGSASICSPPGIECKETKVIEKRRRKKKKEKKG